MELKNFAHMNTSNSDKLATWERGHRVENFWTIKDRKWRLNNSNPDRVAILQYTNFTLVEIKHGKISLVLLGMIECANHFLAFLAIVCIWIPCDIWSELKTTDVQRKEPHWECKYSSWLEKTWALNGGEEMMLTLLLRYWKVLKVASQFSLH